MAEKKKGVKGKITQTAEQTAAVLPPVETAANGESAVEAEVKPVRKRKSAAAWEEKPAEIKEESSAAGEDTVPQIPEEDKKQTEDAEIKEEKPGKKRAKKNRRAQGGSGGKAVRPAEGGGKAGGRGICRNCGNSRHGDGGNSRHGLRGAGNRAGGQGREKTRQIRQKEEGSKALRLSA